MSRCKGPNAARIQWHCDMQHGLVDGQCIECRLMAEAGSNLSLEQIDAIRDAIRRREQPQPQLLAVKARIDGREIVLRPSDVDLFYAG